MRVSIAYFAGVATVILAIATGLGGGLLLGDVMNPQGSKQAEATRFDQRAPIPAINGAAQPVPFMAATQVAATVGAPQAPKQTEPQPSQQAQPQSQQASTEPAEPKPSPERNAPAQSAAAPAQPTAAREGAAPEDSFAKARDDEVRRDARRAEDRDRRKAERRAQRAERRKWRQRDREGDELNRAETGARETTQSWPPFIRQPAYGTGRMTLFDD